MTPRELAKAPPEVASEPTERSKVRFGPQPSPAKTPLPVAYRSDPGRLRPG
jgi:hypothetical protein